MTVLLDQAIDLAPHDDLGLTVAAIAADRHLWEDRVRMLPWRWWTQLHRDDDLDVWLISWPRGSATDLHDHGSSEGAFTVVRGHLTELRPFESGPRLRTSKYAAGQTVTVPVGAVHDVWNADPTPAVSIHAYSPPLSSMTFYAAVGGELAPVRTVATDEPEAVR